MSTNVEPVSVFKERSVMKKWYSIPKRYIQAVLAFLALFIIYWMRTSFYAAIFHILATESIHIDETVSWSHLDINLMDSAFSWGFTAAQIPGALLTFRYSSHRVLLLSMVVTITLHTLLPLFLRSSAPYIIITRLLQGMAEGPIFPACAGIWKLWAPPSERTRLFCIALCGSFFGSVAGLPLNVALADNFGGKACFFISSVSGLIWCLLWSVQIYESPSSHPYISHYELSYLEENVNVDNKVETTVQSVPWKSIFKSLPVSAICLANYCYCYSQYILSISPYLYRFELGYGMIHTMLDILLPNIIIGVIVLASGFIADFLINRVHLSRTIVRKVFCCGAFTLHGIVFLVIRYSKDIEYAVICLTLAHGFMGLSIAGFLVNCLDFSPCYATIVMAICQTFGSISDIITPIIIHNLWSQTLIGWSGTFDTLISMSFVVALLYGFWGSGEVQWWGKPETICTPAAGDDSSRSTYYSYPDGEDCVELVGHAQQLSNVCTESEKERY